MDTFGELQIYSLCWAECGLFAITEAKCGKIHNVVFMRGTRIISRWLRATSITFDLIMLETSVKHVVFTASARMCHVVGQG